LSTPKNATPDTLTLTRESLEQAMMTWTKQHEGPIGYEYVGLLLSDGEVLEALDRVAVSMQVKQASFCDNNECLIWSAWMNLQEFGTPGFPLTRKPLDLD
jgi:hypothetical protein